MCEYITPNGKICIHSKIYQSNFCHLKSHYPSIANYEETIQNQENHFFSLTKDIPVINRFFYNPRSNGACMYSCFANYLLNNPQIMNKMNTICIFYNINEEDLINKKDIDILTIIIQKLIKKYIVQNKNNVIPNNEITWEYLIRTCHCLSIEDYDKWFEIPAKNSDIMTINKKVVEIPLRWGTIAELLAFCYLFEINAEIYFPVCLDKIYNIVNSSFYLSKTRFQLIENIHIFDNCDNIIKLIHSHNHYIDCSLSTFH
jgi:hypothetical protein